jgi:hypothetical protein
MTPASATALRAASCSTWWRASAEPQGDISSCRDPHVGLAQAHQVTDDCRASPDEGQPQPQSAHGIRAALPNFAISRSRRRHCAAPLAGVSAGLWP